MTFDHPFDFTRLFAARGGGFAPPLYNGSQAISNTIDVNDAGVLDM